MLGVNSSYSFPNKCTVSVQLNPFRKSLLLNGTISCFTHISLCLKCLKITFN